MNDQSEAAQKGSSQMEPWPELEPYSRMIHLDVSQVDLFYFDTKGEDLPVCVLIHGLADEADSWRHIVTPLSETHRVIVPDLPGFGRSSKPKTRYTVPWMSSVLCEFLDSLAVNDALLCGSSLGGILSQNLSRDRPDLVSSLVLVDGVVPSLPQKINMALLLFLIPFAGEFLYKRLRQDPEGAYRTLMPYYHDLSGLSAEDRAFLYKRVNQRVWDEDQMFAFFSILRNLGPWMKKQNKAFTAAVKKMNIPTLILWGEDDYIMPIANGRALKHLDDSIDFEIVKEAGHLPHQEQAEAFLTLVRVFLEKQKV